MPSCRSASVEALRRVSKVLIHRNRAVWVEWLNWDMVIPMRVPGFASDRIEGFQAREGRVVGESSGLGVIGRVVEIEIGKQGKTVFKTRCGRGVRCGTLY